MENGLEKKICTNKLADSARKISEENRVSFGFLPQKGYYFRTSNEEKKERIFEAIKIEGYSPNIELYHGKKVVFMGYRKK